MATEGGGPHTDLGAPGGAVVGGPAGPRAEGESGSTCEGPSDALVVGAGRIERPSAEPAPSAAAGRPLDREPETGSKPEAGPPALAIAPALTRTEPDGPPPAPLPAPMHPHAPARRLFEEGFNFDFFQAVRLLQRMEAGRALVGHSGPPVAEAVRFRARISLSFPPSSIYEILRPTSSRPVPVMVQAFMGLTGPSGVLPRHYTELLYTIERDVRTPDKHALRDWLDLFNHRMVSLFYRAWEKYRFYIPFERGDYDGAEPDPFTQALYSLVGLGPPPLRRRLRVVAQDEVDEYGEPKERVLAQVEDLVLLHFGGLLGHRPRCAVGLEAMLRDYFQVPARIEQFRGQWLKLEPPSQTRLGGERGNNEVGVSAVAGRRVWDRQSKFRVRIDSMTYAQFIEFLPDRAPIRERKTFFLLVHLVRLYADPGLDFDVQLVLKAEEVPKLQLTGAGTFGAHLGWNTWLLARPMCADADDAIIDDVKAFERGYP
jgi:type VI secretion system protein ImpH